NVAKSFAYLQLYLRGTLGRALYSQNYRQQGEGPKHWVTRRDNNQLVKDAVPVIKCARGCYWKYPGPPPHTYEVALHAYLCTETLSDIYTPLTGNMD
ncbi:MAG: hypothetical protein OXF08_09060, partial [Bacteroidetes bacterium]|nr:hypothetical protein [Bacteroidota bacterium]